VSDFDVDKVLTPFTTFKKKNEKGRSYYILHVIEGNSVFVIVDGTFGSLSVLHYTLDRFSA
jgi:hypothetical protein